jgi:hypothetical protein
MLLDFARAEIEREAEALRLVSGRDAVVSGDMLSLAAPAGLARPPVDEPTWELVVWVRISWFDTTLGDGVSALTPMRVPRSTGVLFSISLWENQGVMVDAPSVPRTRTLSIEFYTRFYNTAVVGTPVFDDGRPYEGTVRFTLREVELPAVVDTGVNYTITIPPEGLVQAFSASEAEQLMGLRPTLDSITRVR